MVALGMFSPEHCAKISAGRLRAVERMKSEAGFIYLAAVVGTDTVKIGYTANVARRLKLLNRTGYRHFQYHLLASIPGSFADEQRLHRSLRKLRTPGIGNTSEYYPRSIFSHPALPPPLKSALRALEQAEYQTCPKWAAFLRSQALCEAA